MADRTLPGLGLKGFWGLGESGWKADNDLNLLIMSAILGQSALSLVNADPGAPTDGDIHLLSDTHPTHPGAIAIRDAGAWVYVDVPQGVRMYDVGTAKHRWFDGTTWAELATSGGGGGGGGIGGVLVTGASVNIHNDALVCTDSPYVVISFWIKYYTDADRHKAITYANDPANEYGNWMGGKFTGTGGDPENDKLVAVFEDEDAFSYHRCESTTKATSGVWQHILIAFKGVAGGGHQNQMAMYLNRVQCPLTHVHDTFTITPTFNGKAFYVASDSYNSDAISWEEAEFFLATGHDIIESDGTITDANLDKFITTDLKPADLGADGSTPFGEQPAIYLSRKQGDPAASFATNLGSGGAFTLDGVLGDPVDNPGD